MTQEQPAKRKTFLYLIIAVLAVAGLVAAWSLFPLNQWVEAFRLWVRDLGPTGWIIFILVYALSVFALVPGALLTLAAGVAYGLWGAPLVVIGATLGASLSFLSGRYLFRERIRNLIANRPKLKAVDRAIGDEGWRIAILLRLSPVVPFSLQNWALGGTSLGFPAFVFATFFGIIPGTLLYVWIGSLGGAAGAGVGFVRAVILTLGLLATGVTVWLVSRKARQILAEKDIEASEGQESEQSA